MYSNNLDIDIIDFLDLINETLSISFIEKWRHKYSEKFIKHFQLKLLDSMNKQKPIKIEMLFNYLTKKCKYSPEQVYNFFDTIEIEIYRPFIYGTLSKPSF
jgi:hypothetical protein